MNGCLLPCIPGSSWGFGYTTENAPDCLNDLRLDMERVVGGYRECGINAAGRHRYPQLKSLA